MKGLQFLVQKYLKDHEKQKRYLAIIMCLSAIVTFAVPMSLIMPAISMTNSDSTDESPPISPLANETQGGQTLTNAAGAGGNIVDDITYSPMEMSLKTLLIGTGEGVSWADDCETVDEIMDAAMDEYFLGIANDFCAFIEGDFNATDADAEGRVLIGGDMTFSGAWNYQVGSGDYATMTHLSSTDNYKSIADFASVIVGGRMENINTLSTGYGHERDGKNDWNKDDRIEKDSGYHAVNINNQYAKDSYTVYYTPNEGLYKRFIVGNIGDSLHIDDSSGSDSEYTTAHSHDYPGDCGADCPHSYLNNINELAQMYQYNGIPDIVKKSFEQIRARSVLLSQKKTTNADSQGKFVGPGTDSKAKTVYFNIDNWGDRNKIDFSGIPEGANIVVNVKGKDIKLNGFNTFETKINDKTISNTGNEHSNNHTDSQRILYNFYEAEKVEIGGNFNGTILAPNANVTSPDKCPGHLSGALIAKSFKGGLEFGYRPYRGKADILGSPSGYTIPVDKFSSITDENGNKSHLSGAAISIYDTNNTPDNNSDDSLLTAWSSTDETKYASVPTAVDYTGETDYTDKTKFGDGNIVLTKTYRLEETSAPDGYVKGTNKYTIEVKETIDKDYLFSDGSGIFPQKVDVEVKITELEKSSDGGYVTKPNSSPQVLKFTVKDAYGDKGLVQRRVYIPDSSKPTDVFAVDVDTTSSKQEITAVRKYNSIDDVTGGKDEEAVTGTVSQTVLFDPPAPVTTTSSQDSSQESQETTTVATRVKTYTCTQQIKQEDEKIDITQWFTGNVTNISFDVESENSDFSGDLVAYSKNGDDYSELLRIPIGNSNTNINQAVEIKKIDAVEVLIYNNPFTVKNLTFTYTVDNIFTVSPENTSLTVGDSTKLNITNAVGDINWVCPEGCTISGNATDGYALKVTKPGDFTISGTDSDRDENNTSGKTGSFKVHVDPFYITAENATVTNGSEITLTANKQADWTITGDSIAEITKDETDKTKCKVKIKDTGSGNATITATYTVGENETYTANAEINIPEPRILYKKVKKVETTGANVVAPTKSSEFFVGESDNQARYYYSKDSIMVMPLPENNTEFINKPGLVFKKVDDTGTDVKGATITLTSGNTSVAADVWTWDSKESSQTIDVSKLTTNVVYTFTETVVPDKHEKALPIHFEMTSENGIEWWQSESSERPTDESLINKLNLPGDHTIKMVDSRKLGVIPSLKKVHYEKEDGTKSDTPINLPGATIELYYNGETEAICKWENFSGEETSMGDKLKEITDNPHVENGYLKPGVYYLKESKIPKCGTGDSAEEHKDPGKMYFTVTNNFTIEPGYSSTKQLSITEWDTDHRRLVLPDGGIKNVVYIHVEADQTFKQLYTSTSGITIQHESDATSFTWPGSGNSNTPTDLSMLEIKQYGGPKPTFTYVEIKTSDEITYVYGTNPDPSSESASSDNNVNSALDISRNILTVINKPQGDKKNITVNKTWAGDGDFTVLRGDVKYSLYKTTTDITGKSTEELQKLITDGSATEIKITDLDTTVEDEDDSTKTYTNPTAFKINDANKWEQTIYGLAAKENGQKLYYFVIEEPTITGYTPTYSFTGDTITITNTLEKIKVNVEKIWEDDKGVKKPESLTLKLEMKNGDGWIAVKDILLTPDEFDKWTAEAEVPAGKEYQINEINVPYGWSKTVNGQGKTDTIAAAKNGDTLTITNKPKLGKLIVSKLWNNDEESNRPGSVNVKIYRTTKVPDKFLPYPSKQSTKATQEDYARLLQYSLYFYDANMCGDQVDENSAYSWREDCHTHDEVVGGFHDAGDHVMFGLPQGYTASIMSWNLYEFPGAYSNLNQTGHAKVIIDYFCDFINRCVHYNEDESVKEILVQKGNPTKDHSYWGVPEKQESIQGKRDSKETWWDSDGCADIAYEYAAALASAYVNANAGNFGEEAKTDLKYNTYLETAKKLFQFAENCQNKQSKSKIETTCYSSGSWEDDRSWAATWLKIATNDSSYDTYLITNSTDLNVSWDHVETAATLLNAGHINTDQQSSVADNVYYKLPGGNDYMFGGDSGGWGNMRHNAAYQMTALVAAKYQSDSTKKARMQEWAKAQMAIILGNNDESGNERYDDNDITGFTDLSKGNSINHIRERTCFVTNFSKDTLLHPHYRATCNPDYSKDMGGKDNSDIIDGYDLDKNFLIGGLAGGWQDESGRTYRDERSIYKVNEVAIDYNACFVGAAAGLYDAYHTGKTYMIPKEAGVKTQYVTTEPGEYYELSTEEQAAQTFTANAALPVLTFGMVKQVRAAESGRDENGSYYIISGDKLTDSIFTDIPEEIKNAKITKIVAEMNCDDGGGIAYIKYQKNQYETPQKEFSYSPSNTKGEIDISDIDFATQPITAIGYTKYWGSSTHSVKEFRFYYDAGNTFTITPESDKLLSGESTILTINGTNDAITWETPVSGSITSNGDDKYTYTAGTVDNETQVTISGESGELNGTCTVTVYKELEISADKTEVYPGDTVTLDSNVPVTWSADAGSFNGNVYTVPNQTGSITITGTHTGTNSSHSMDIELTVKEKPLTITRTSGSEVMAGGTVTITSDTDISEWVYSQDILEAPSKSDPDGSGNYTYTFKVKDTVTQAQDVTIKAKDGGKESNEVTVHVKISDFTISADKTDLTGGDTLTVTVDKTIQNIEWVLTGDKNNMWDIFDMNNMKHVNNTYSFPVKKSASGNFSLQAKYNNNNNMETSNVISFKINPLTFNIKSDKEKVKAGETFKITITKPDNLTLGNLNWSVKDSNGNDNYNFDRTGSDSEYTFTPQNQVASGNYTIQASCNDGGNIYSNQITIQVEAFEISATIAPSSVHANEQFTITANADISDWSVDNKNKDDLFERIQDNDNKKLILKVKENAAPGSYTIKLKNNTNNQDHWTNVTVEVKPPRCLIITANPAELYPGNTATLTVLDSETNKAYEGTVTLTADSGSVSGNVYTAGGKTGTVTITATAESGNLTGSCTLNVKKIEAEPVLVRKGNTAAIKLKGDYTGQTITYISDDTAKAIFSENKVTGVEIGNTTLTISCNGVSTDCKVTVQVLDALSIEGLSQMKPNSSINLKAINSIGTVTWNLTENSDPNIANVSSNGVVEAKDNGTVTITATDTYDWTVATFTITIKDMAAVVELPEGSEQVGDIIKIQATDKVGDADWSKQIENLPLTDENGNTYYYYIVEVDENGNVINDTNNLKGNKAKYIPINYDNNGVSLDESKPETISVKNKKIGDTMGELPLTGGNGTTRYYVTGMIIICSAAAYYLIRRRKNNVAK